LEFSQITGYGEKSLSNFLTGRVKYPKIDLIDAVIRNFPDLNLIWLFTGEGEMFTNENFTSEQVQNELDNLRMENSKLKDKIIELLEK
jgi:hypothetical protein